MQKESQLSPATWVLAGKREALLEYARLYELKKYIWPLLVAAAIAIPVGLKRDQSVSPNQRTAQSGIDTVNHPTDSTFARLVDKETRKQGNEVVPSAKFPPRLPVFFVTAQPLATFNLQPAICNLPVNAPVSPPYAIISLCCIFSLCRGQALAVALAGRRKAVPLQSEKILCVPRSTSILLRRPIHGKRRCKAVGRNSC